ncbi:MAG: hypothetical protein ACRD1X_01560, partial [Vicinamibacteria bacterium]
MLRMKPCGAPAARLRNKLSSARWLGPLFGKGRGIGLVLSTVLVLGAGNADAQEGDDAAVIDSDLPSTLSCGQSYLASVTMQNTGATVWTEAEGYRLGALDDSDDLFGPGRVFLPDGVSVAPGESYT